MACAGRTKFLRDVPQLAVILLTGAGGFFLLLNVIAFDLLRSLTDGRGGGIFIQDSVAHDIMLITGTVFVGVVMTVAGFFSAVGITGERLDDDPYAAAGVHKAP